jgi:hypothetical protein
MKFLTDVEQIAPPSAHRANHESFSLRIASGGGGGLGRYFSSWGRWDADFLDADHVDANHAQAFLRACTIASS